MHVLPIFDKLSTLAQHNRQQDYALRQQPKKSQVYVGSITTFNLE